MAKTNEFQQRLWLNVFEGIILHKYQHGKNKRKIETGAIESFPKPYLTITVVQAA